jgi:hypothetical protein
MLEKVNRTFLQILTHPHSKWAWELARSHVQMPEPSPGFSLRNWDLFLFGDDTSCAVRIFLLLKEISDFATLGVHPSNQTSDFLFPSPTPVVSGLQKEVSAFPSKQYICVDSLFRTASFVTHKPSGTLPPISKLTAQY